VKSLAIFGASGHGKVLADTATTIGWQKVVFFDDAWPNIISNGQWEIVGDMKTLLSRLTEFDGILVGIGNCSIRWQKHQLLKTAGAPLITLIHPHAYISPTVDIGAGTVVMAGAVVNVDTMIGDACIVNTASSVDHDCIIGHAVHIAPGVHLSGNITIGKGSWLGVGAIVRQGIQIGSDVMVGAGAVVVKSVSNGLTVIGNPARPLNNNCS
jgi:sugar O-acyltransferase (sialic acid O-acetyltransferase NeuD family)